MRGAVDAVDSVHGDGDLPRIPIKPGAGRSRIGGFTIETYNNMPVEITVSRKSPHPRMTTAHEIGHFVDFMGLGDRDRYGAWYGSQRSEALEEWRAAVNDSKAAQRLLELYRQDTVKVGRPGAEFDYAPDKQYIRYLGQTKEMFARSYSQWVATRSGDAKMLQELADLQAEKVEHGLHYPTQWDDDDFEPIGRALDNLFKALGWLQ